MNTLPLIPDGMTFDEAAALLVAEVAGPDTFDWGPLAGLVAFEDNPPPFNVDLRPLALLAGLVGWSLVELWRWLVRR